MLSDEIYWDGSRTETPASSAPRVVRKPGVRGRHAGRQSAHQGYAPKRSMLLVWENAAGDLPELISSGKLPTYPVEL
jgi:hypothetical protein